MLETLLLFAILAFALTILIVLLRPKKDQAIDQTPLLNKLEFLEKNHQRFENELKNEFRQNRSELASNLSGFQGQFLETLKEISRNQQEQLKNISETSRQSIFNLNQTLEEKLGQLITRNDEAARVSRSEHSSNLKQLNEEIRLKLTDLGQAQKDQNTTQVKQLELVNQKLEEKLGQLSERFQAYTKESRDSLEQSMRHFQTSFTNNVKEFNDLQKQKFSDLEKKQDALITSTELKLEKMRETVDEKLQKTLETRLGQSFELVSKQLESVQKGLGEMQTLANDVGGLKRVLSNVKTRGVLGEIQLGNILEQILAPEQYETNVKTKRSSGDHVEFAIKLPGRDEDGGSVYLPIDAKFPQEAYHLLQTAYDEGNMVKVDEAVKILVRSIKTFAKDIRDKYLDPPYTTDFGIMFLPIEGLYAEVIRHTDLVEQLQREFKIIVTGPTTLAAILNSLQMGFKTLAIQKRSSEVWRILGEVKTEFGKFGDVLKKAQQKITEANTEIDRLVTTRTNVLTRKLRAVQELPAAEDNKLIDEGLLFDEESEN
ncbi:MAG: DNA recombination protein RmuC [Bacteroidetes bacterium]|nr:DNA recombination protein RmuC [Bacteroidota bacterium]MBU1580286.1 DNA recombination protein RmuC [Bacteroidota bacterium]MBU2556554.1 DNA recombination protein RmuC [Bacteroidota bacterium]